MELLKTRLTTERVLGAALTALVSLLFFSLYWNRFLGLRSGTGSYSAGVALLDGILPYRDYFLASTPLNILKSAAVLHIFGGSMITLRAFDVVERIGLALLVYLWLIRLFSVQDSTLASIVTIVVSAADVADPISSYNHDAIFWAVAGGLVASFTLDPSRSSKSLITLSIVCGLLTGLSFATKQTIGLAVTVGIPAVAAICIFRLTGTRKGLVFVGAYILGWCFSAGALLWWMSSAGVLSNFVNQAFVKGPAAKASHPADFLLRFILVAKTMRWAVLFALGALVAGFRNWRYTKSAETSSESGRGLWWTALFAIISICIGIAASHTQLPADRLWSYIGKPSIFFTLFSVTFLLGYYTFLWVSRGVCWREAQYFLLAMVAFAIASTLSLSWPAFEAMVAPGLGFLIAATLRCQRGWGRYFVYLISGMLIFGATLSKLDLPFSFLDLDEPPVRNARFTSSLSELKGFLLPESTVRFVDETVHVIRAHSAISDTIFIYPEMSVFYPLTHRRAPTETSSHNIDVVNDEFARSEAHKLLLARPSVLVYYKQPESFLSGQEYIWRKGRRSGQRDLIFAVESLAVGYQLAGRFDMPVARREIDVYVKK